MRWSYISRSSAIRFRMASGYLIRDTHLLRYYDPGLRELSEKQHLICFDQLTLILFGPTVFTSHYHE